jgi:hypothetical protein
MAEFYNSLPASDQEALGQLVGSSPAFKREFNAFFGKFLTLFCLWKKYSSRRGTIFGLIKLERHQFMRSCFGANYCTAFLQIFLF